MEAFRVFATMSLVDAVSKPLAAIRGSMGETEKSAASLSSRLGGLAVKLGKVAAAGAAFLGALGLTTQAAIAFESKMADVAKVVDFESPAELEAMSQTIQDLSLQIPIAAEGFADIVAAAAQSGVAKKDLTAFSVQAAKMGVAFDVAAGEASKTMADWRAGMGLTLEQTYSLADAVNHLANNLNATAPEIAQVLNRMGAVGKAAGFTEKQLAALAATGLSAGASAEVVGTGFNSIFATLTSGAAMTDSAAKALKGLGFESQALAKAMQVDAKGTIFSVLESIANLPKDLQLTTVNNLFGQMSLKSIAPMIGNLDNLRQAFGLVGDAANYAGSMEAEYAARSATTENSLQLFKNSLNVLAITVGSLFLPVVNAAAKALSLITKTLVAVARTEAGGFILKLAAGLAAALVGAGGLVTALALLKPVILMVSAALSGVFWPITLIAGGIALIALAWKKDFGGLATTVTAFAAKVKLVFQAVREVFANLAGGQATLSAEMSKKIEAAGLLGLVTTVSRIIYRISKIFSGFKQVVKAGLGEAWETIKPAFSALGETIKPLADLFSGLIGKMTGAAGATKTESWLNFGRIIGKLATIQMRVLLAILKPLIRFLTGVFQGIKLAADGLGQRLGPAFERVKTALGPLMALIKNLAGRFLNLGQSAGEASAQTGVDKWVSLGETVGTFLVWAFETAVNTIATAIEGVSGFASEIGFFLSEIKDMVNNFSLAEAGRALIDGFTDGVKSAAETLITTVAGILARVRDFLPFSDAKTGPFSNLTASGQAFIETIKAGIISRAEGLVTAVKNVLAQVRQYLPFSDAKTGPMSNLTASGRAFPATLAQGVKAGAPELINASSQMMSHLNLNSNPLNWGFDPSLTARLHLARPIIDPAVYSPRPVPDLFSPAGPGPAEARASFISAPKVVFDPTGPAVPIAPKSPAKTDNKTVHIHIGRLELPQVSDADGFVAALEAIAAERSF